MYPDLYKKSVLGTLFSAGVLFSGYANAANYDRDITFSLTPGNTSYDSSVKFTWNADKKGLSKDGTFVSRYSGGKPTHRYVQGGAKSGSKTIKGLSNGTHTFCLDFETVGLSSEDETSLPPETVYEDYQKCATVKVNVGTPSISLASKDHDGSFSLNWGSVTSASRYEVYQQINSGSWSRVVNSKVNRYSKSNVSNATYRYKARACFANGHCGSFSSVKSIAVQRIPQAAPSSLSVPSYTTGSSATVSWGSATDASRYELYQKEGTGSWAKVYTGASRSIKVSNLKNAKYYTYQVRACSSYGCGPYKGSTVKLYSYYTPATPTLNVTGQSNLGNITASWNKPAYATKFELDNGSSTLYAGSGTSKAFSGLNNGTYKYRVRAANAKGTWSAWSGYKSFKIDKTVPVPTGLSLPPTSTTGDYDVIWTKSSDSSLTYELFDGTGARVYQDSGNLKRFYNQANGTYKYRLRACSTVACSGFTAYKQIVVNSSPNAPILSSLPAATAQSYTVSWNRPSRAAKFDLQRSFNGGSYTTVKSGNITSFTETVPSSSKPDGTYSYRVRSCDEKNACSGYSAVKSVRVDTVPTVGSISGPSTSESGNFELTFSSHALATKYELANVSGTRLYSGTSPRYLVNGAGDGRHGYKYRACNQHNNCSPYSSVKYVQVELLRAPDAPNPITAPASSDENGYSLSWPTMARATSYQLERNVSGTGWKLAANTNANSYVYNEQPMAYGLHAYRVKACNSVGCSGYSPVIQVKVELDPTAKIRKQLYYGEAANIPADQENQALGQFSRELAAFRYLDLMYVLDPSTQKVTNRFASGESAPDFTTLYDARERERVLLVEDLIQEQLAAHPSNTNVQRFLLDLYYDQAVAELILANQSIDKARISRLRDEGLTTEMDHLADAASILENGLNRYWSVVQDHSDILIRWEASRGQNSPRYRDANDFAQNVVDEERLFSGYKDVVMFYQLMTKLAETKRQYAHLSLVSGQTNQTLLDNLNNELVALNAFLADKALQLQGLFPNQALSEVQGQTGLPQSIVRFNAAQDELTHAETWIKGDTNPLGLPKDTVLLVQGYGIDGNIQYDSFDALKAMLETSNGPIQQAKNSFSEAMSRYETYKQNQDQLKTEYKDRTQSLNNWLYDLIGWEFDAACGEQPCVISSEAAVKGSAISLQQANIKSANLALDKNIQRMEDLLTNIEIEVERRAQEANINDGISQIYLDYGEKQADIVTQIAKIREQAERARRKSSLFGGIVSTVVNFYTGNWVGAANSLNGTINGVVNHNINIRGIKKEGELQRLSQQLAAEERAELNAQNDKLLDNNSKARIRSMWLEANTLALDIALAEATVEQESERLIGMLNSAKRILAQVHETQENLVERYFADPIHTTRLSTSMLRAEQDFSRAQEWLFYTARALEYKWQEPFEDRTTGLTTDSVFGLRNADDLQDFLSALRDFDGFRNLQGTQQATDTYSLKEDWFGYIDRVRRVTQYYPHPDPAIGEAQMLTAQEAFSEQLKLLTRRVGADHWMTVEFNTVKELPRSNFFLGPIVADHNDITCLADGGSYLDKIESVAVNMPIAWDESGELDTPAYLTYGGNSFMRAKTPGSLTEDGLGIKDELIHYSTRFWDAGSGNQLKFKDNFRQQMKASLTVDGDSTRTQPTFVFKERSVAASGWRLSVKMADRTGPIVDIESVDDIELIFKHRYKSRNFDTCGDDGGGPLLLLSPPPFDLPIEIGEPILKPVKPEPIEGPNPPAEEF